MIRITLEEKARALAQRKEALGITGRDYVAVNTGKHRTEAKRELLRTIQRDAEERGIPPRFRAIIG